MDESIDFGKMIDNLVESASRAIDSAYVTEDFMIAVDQSLGDIHNLVDSLTDSEKHGNPPNTT